MKKGKFVEEGYVKESAGQTYQQVVITTAQKKFKQKQEKEERGILKGWTGWLGRGKWRMNHGFLFEHRCGFGKAWGLAGGNSTVEKKKKRNGWRK